MLQGPCHAKSLSPSGVTPSYTHYLAGIAGRLPTLGPNRRTPCSVSQISPCSRAELNCAIRAVPARVNSVFRKFQHCWHSFGAFDVTRPIKERRRLQKGGFTGLLFGIRRAPVPRKSSPDKDEKRPVPTLREFACKLLNQRSECGCVFR